MASVEQFIDCLQLTMAKAAQKRKYKRTSHCNTGKNQQPPQIAGAYQLIYDLRRHIQREVRL